MKEGTCPTVTELAIRFRRELSAFCCFFFCYALSLSNFMLFRLNDWLKPLNSKLKTYMGAAALLGFCHPVIVALKAQIALRTQKKSQKSIG